MINIETFVFNPFMENTYLLSDSSGECIIVDAGCYEQEEKEKFAGFIEAGNLKPVALVNTHCHIDHVLGVSYLKERYGIPFSIHRQEELLLRETVAQGNFFGLEPGTPAEPDHFLEEGDKITFGTSSLSILHVPGHSPGSLALYSPGEKFLLGGDVLFRGSIGRTDLPGGDHRTLISSIHDKLMVLDADTRILPGHGPETSIAVERDTNPFLNHYKQG